MKKILFTLLLLIFFIPSVNAELLYENQQFSLLNRRYSAFPFETWYASGESTTYTDSNYIEIPSTSITGVGMLPKYIYAISCATGALDLNTISVTNGDLSNYGSVIGGTCTVNGYTGNYYLNRWEIKQWRYTTGVLSDTVYSVMWTINITNTASYNIFTRYESIFLSNELINDFSNEYLLRILIEQNSSLRSSVNSLQSSTNETNNKLDETNEQLGQTNEQLGEMNDNITSTEGPTNIGALDNSAGWLPAGPVDSILNLPLSLLNSLLTAVSSTCQPLDITFPFVDFSYQLPCISSIYAKINGLNAIIDLIGYTVGVLILYYYFKHLYKWIDNKITMQNDNDWGGI